MTVLGHGADLCTSTTRPNPTLGAIIFETDTMSYRWYNGSAWVGIIPEGTVQPYTGANAPTGWLLCFGQTLNSVTNPEYTPLYNVIGVTYGGTGASSFILPDLRGRSVFGKDNMGGTTASRVTNTGTDNSGIAGTTLGAVGGDQRMHGHTHIQNAHSHSYSRGINGGYRHANDNNNIAYFHTYDTPQTGSTTATNQTTGTGGGQNMPPAIILNYIIKY